MYDTRQDKRKHYLGKKALQHFQIPPFQHNPEYGVLICRDGETQSKIAIMLDDIFYASDFHNRRNIKHFVKAILTAYKSIFENGKDNSEQPDKIGSKLQLVIFTHDELVFKSITDEIKEFHKNDYRKYFMFHSLLPHKEAAPDSNFEISNLVFNLNERNDE